MQEVRNVFSEDRKQICDSPFVPWEKLRDKTVFVTGATGLIGFNLIEALLYAGRKRDLNLRILALVRDREKAEERFASAGKNGNGIRFVEGCIEDLPDPEGPVDYIVHGAAQTASGMFVKQPAETIRTSIWGAGNVLEFARHKRVLGMVYLSSMEVYGQPPRGHKVTEKESGVFSPLDMRNCYPLSKQLCENLCCAYASEYGVPVMIARLAQVFGPGMHWRDRRIFAEFARCVAEKKNIILKTRGETERSYLYAADAVTAILTVLLKGKPGCAYNAADEESYCSIAEAAEKIAGISGIKVCFELQDEKQLGYPKTAYLDLDTEELRALGWNPGRKFEENLERFAGMYAQKGLKQ